MLDLTDEDILKDIEGFKARINQAKERLAALPATAPDWKGRKKLAEKKRILNDDIRHVRKLIDIAQRALST